MSSESQTVASSKTCPEDVLRQLVEQDALELPLLPETASKLVGLCNQQEVLPAKLAECIRRDQSIATHVLRMANSAIYSTGSPVVSLKQAVTRLGMNRIREVVLIIACQGRVFEAAGFEKEVRESFQRSLAVAVFAEEIARNQKLNVEDAFLCGLLHDVGRPVLLQSLVDYQKAEKLEFSREAVLDSVEAFRKEVGANLIRRWALPEHVALTVRDQGDVSADCTNQSAKLLSLALGFAEHYFESRDADQTVLLQHPMVAALNLYPEQIEEVLEKCIAILDQTLE